MQTVRFYIAASSELQEDRESLLQFVSYEIKKWAPDDSNIGFVTWEDYLDTASQTRIQEEFSKVIVQADIFVMLLFTKVGRYSAEEFENAFKINKDRGKPLIYIYFKESQDILGTIDKSDLESLLHFQKRLEELAYSPRKYNDSTDLCNQFSKELEKIFSEKLLEKDLKSKIDEEIKNRTGTLNLSGYILSAVPAEISTLDWLTKLDLSKNNITQLDHLQNLKALVSLDLNHNKLSDLNNLPVDSPLEELDVSSNKLKSLEPITVFSKLKFLHAKYNEIEKIDSLKKMTSLKLIVLDHNQIKSITPLRQHITDGIQISFSYTTDKHEGIFVRDNPLSEPPLEVISKGNDAVLTYFKDSGDDDKPLNIVKLILVGNSTVGKTNLSEFLKTGETACKRNSTNLLEISLWEPDYLKTDDKEQIKVNIFDFGGQDYYHDSHRMYFSHDTAYILLWDTFTDNYKAAGQPNETAPELQPFENFPIPYWLESIKFNLTTKRTATAPGEPGGTSVSKTILPHILIIQNKIDKGEGNQNQALLSKKYDNIWGYFNLSLLEKKRVGILEEILKEYFAALKLAGRKLLAYQMKIVNHFFERNKTLEIFSFTAFLEKCRQIINNASIHFEPDDADTIAQILNNSGIIFYDRNNGSDGTIYTSITQLNENIKSILDTARPPGDGKIRRTDLEKIDHYRDMLGLLCKNKSIVQLDEETYLTSQFLPLVPDTFVNTFLPGFNFIQMRFVYEAYYHKSILLTLYAYYYAATSQASPADKPLIWRDGMILIRTDGNKRSLVYVEFKKSESGGIINIRTAKPFSRFDFEKEVENMLGSLNEGWEHTREYSADNETYFSLPELQRYVTNKVVEFDRNNKKFGINDFKQMVEFFNLPKRLFISYSSRDAAFMQRFITHLEVLKREGQIDPWYDRMIESGTKWDDTIRKELERADLVIFLLSPDFLATDYIFNVEIKEAIKLRDAGDLEFFFIELRSCNWKATKLKAYQQTDNSKQAEKNVITIGESNNDRNWIKAVDELQIKIGSLKNKQNAVGTFNTEVPV